MFIYHLGIIDYLQDYNMDKKGEHWLKSFIADANLISAIPPKPYSQRFFQFMQDQVVINQNHSDSVRKEIRLDKLLKELKKNSFKAK